MGLQDFDHEVLFTEGRELVEDVLDSDNEDEVIEAIAEFLDSVIPMRALVPGIAGVLLEQADFTVFELVLKGLKASVKGIKVDPDKKAERKARRAARRAARKEAREARRAERAARRAEKQED